MELTVNGRIYGYLKIYEECIHPNFAAKGEDAVFGKMMASNSHQEQLVGGVSDFFAQAGLRKDIRVAATKIIKLFRDKDFEMSLTNAS